MIFNINPQVSFDASLSSDKVDGFDMLEELLQKKEELEEQAANIFVEELRLEVDNSLYSTKERYMSAVSVDDNTVTLDTSDFVVGMIENGVEPFDMKPGHLNGPKVKVNKQGKKYAVVPVGKYKQGRYNWRDRQTGRFDKGSNPGGDVEFRIISENSPQDSWIHPGYAAKNFMSRTLENIDKRLEELIDSKIEASINKL